MLNGVNQSSFRSFRGFKENICARFFCNQSENCEHTHGLVKMQQIPPQFSGGGSCPWLFVNISFKVKLAHCYLLSSPFSGASHSKFDWSYFFLWACDLLQRRPVALFFEGTSGQNAACGEFCRRRRRNLNDKKSLHQWKRVSVTEIFAKRVSVAEIFAKLQVWDEKLRQMHEIGKRVGIRRKRRSTEWNIFTVEDLANSRTEIKKKR